MRAIKLLITLGVLLTAFLVGGIALANDPSGFDSVSTVGVPKILDVSPNSVRQGDAGVDIYILGEYTHFEQGASEAVFSGTGITVNRTDVEDSTHAIANISVQIDAPPGPRDVNVITRSEVVPEPLEDYFIIVPDRTLEAPKLTVTIEGTKVTLSWNKVAGATGYQVHYAQYPYYKPDSIKTIEMGDKTSTSFDLSPGDAYHVAVRACKDSGFDCSGYSNIHDVIIPLSSTFKNSLGQEFKLIPAGTFTMGSPSDEPGRNSDEIQHQVTLSTSFYMMTTEVTQAQWEAVMGSNPSYFSGCPTCPVETVSWDDVQSYITKMNLRGEGTYGLPTEAQWEYAARAGSTTAFANGGIEDYSDMNECNYDANLNVIGWYCYNSNSKTHTVGQKSPNAWGLYDMSGNVDEWCQDWYSSYPSSVVTDPTGPSSGWNRLLRGGRWSAYARQCRSANRYYINPADRYSILGFRLLRQP